MSTVVEKMINFLNKSHSEFNVCLNAKELLIENGFIELKEDENRNIKPSGKYFITRNSNAILAFKMPEKVDELKFNIVSTHLDSPNLKIKNNPVLIENNYQKLKVETYGGLIKHVRYDKPLSIAGRIVIKDGPKLIEKIVDVEKDLLIIPSVAIHQFDSNNNLNVNPQIDLNPIIGVGDANENQFESLLNEMSESHEVCAYDLYIYNREPAKVVGYKGDFVCGAKLDDTSSFFLSLLALIDSEETHSVEMIVGFDNEEVGSLSLSGADSDFLEVSLKRIALSLSTNEEELYKAYRKSFIMSVDNGHAVHPNHPEVSDNKNIVKLNEGIVLKFNGNMKYTTDAMSTSVVKEIAQASDVPMQIFHNRSDARGGSTLGNISIAHASILTADIGLPQLAMHSNYETMGVDDVNYMYKFLKYFFSKRIEIKEGSITIF